MENWLLCVLVWTRLWNRISHAWENPSGEFHTAMYVSRFPQVYHTFQGLYLPFLRWCHLTFPWLHVFLQGMQYGSANRTMPGNASAKQVSTTSVYRYAFPWKNCEFARFTPTLGSALMFLPEKRLFGGSFPKQQLVIKPDCESKLFELRGSQGLSFFELLSAKHL